MHVHDKLKSTCRAEIYVDEMPEPLLQYQSAYKDVSKSKQAIIVGAGPAGLFAALRLIELGN
jgi:ribulose 1,5-bisphosphate synthetase/thiazole synthase